jgi:hypothetical protein
MFLLSYFYYNNAVDTLFYLVVPLQAQEGKTQRVFASIPIPFPQEPVAAVEGEGEGEGEGEMPVVVVVVEVLIILYRGRK